MSYTVVLNLLLQIINKTFYTEYQCNDLLLQKNLFCHFYIRRCTMYKNAIFTTPVDKWRQNPLDLLYVILRSWKIFYFLTYFFCYTHDDFDYSPALIFTIVVNDRWHSRLQKVKIIDEIESILLLNIFL